MKHLILIAVVLLASCSPHTIEYTGKAENTESGAVLDQKGRIMYIDGLDLWPNDVVGERVAVTGFLVQKHHAKVTSLDAKPDMVIEKPQWKVIK